MEAEGGSAEALLDDDSADGAMDMRRRLGVMDIVAAREGRPVPMLPLVRVRESGSSIIGLFTNFLRCFVMPAEWSKLVPVVVSICRLSPSQSVVDVKSLNGRRTARPYLLSVGLQLVGFASRKYLRERKDDSEEKENGGGGGGRERLLCSDKWHCIL